MVRALEHENEGSSKIRLFDFKGVFDGPGRHAKCSSASAIDSSDEEQSSDKSVSKGKGSNPSGDNAVDEQQNGDAAADAKSKPTAEKIVHKEMKEKLQHDMEQMKERFAKLLLGEDMSGGGKGVSSALALSNAITNLAASVFGEQRRLEPMSAETKARWKKEVDWLLSVTDYIVEMVPSQQKSKDGTTMEIMTTRQRTDLLMNIPALRKLDTMLLDCLDNFKDQNEFYYVKKNADDADTKDDKWWLPTVKVPAEGLSDASRKFLQYQKDCVNQVLKAAMAINAQVLTEMEIPENYIESLPKNGRSSLGESIYKSITVEFFDPDQFLSSMDLSSEHKILDLKNRIEASIVIWRRKMHHKDGKSSWSSGVSMEKRELFEERAETILLIIKQRYPGTPQSALDISKIQYKKDVGQAILESYSRTLETLAFTVRSRIDDVLHADYLTQNPAQTGSKKSPLRSSPQSTREVSFPSPREDIGRGSAETPTSMTLSDCMGWGGDQGENEVNKETVVFADETICKESDGKHRISHIITNKKVFSYLDNLGGLKSPTARH